MACSGPARRGFQILAITVRRLLVQSTDLKEEIVIFEEPQLEVSRRIRVTCMAMRRQHQLLAVKLTGNTTLATHAIDYAAARFSEEAARRAAAGDLLLLDDK